MKVLFVLALALLVAYSNSLDICVVEDVVKCVDPVLNVASNCVLKKNLLSTALNSLGVSVDVSCILSHVDSTLGCTTDFACLILRAANLNPNIIC